MSLLQRLTTTMKKPEMQAQSEQSQAGQNQEANGGKAPVRSQAFDDPLIAKLIDVVQQVIDSRELLKQQVEERDRAIVAHEDQIRELQYDKGFLESKIETLTAELSRAKENVLAMKTQYDQLLAEFNSQRLQQENRIRELQERLSERELTNRQLMLDLNRNQKEFELKMRELKKPRAGQGSQDPASRAETAPGAKRERTPHADHQRFRGAGDGDFEAGRRGGSGIRTADAAVRICQAALRPLRNVVPLSGKCKISARTVQNLDETFTSMAAPDCRCPCRQFFLLQAQGNPIHRGIMQLCRIDSSAGSRSDSYSRRVYRCASPLQERNFNYQQSSL